MLLERRTFINSMGHTHVASTAPAIQPAVMAVNGFLDFFVAILTCLFYIVVVLSLLLLQLLLRNVDGDDVSRLYVV